jgi:hypothetical protein
MTGFDGEVRTARELGIEGVPPYALYAYGVFVIQDGVDERTGAMRWVTKTQMVTCRQRGVIQDSIEEFTRRSGIQSKLKTIRLKELPMKGKYAVTLAILLALPLFASAQTARGPIFGELDGLLPAPRPPFARRIPATSTRVRVFHDQVAEPSLVENLVQLCATGTPKIPVYSSLLR